MALAEGAFDDFRESDDAPPVPEIVLELADAVQDFPRHLGIHSGGMVMADRPLVECCPIEWGRMEGRSVLQWDKDDCAAAGLVKFDLLGLGMLTMLHLAVDLIREHEQVEVDLATIPQEPAVYALLCAADTIGVFQVESRAQMATLPRLRPENFYDLVVEVALIRPGPIQGGSVHPYLRRRNGEEEVTYPHPLLEPCLQKTLGVPLFQEQLMQMAIDAAGFTPGEADQLRQAMGSKRSKERMARMRDRLMSGMAERGIIGETAEEIAKKLEAFASFGFPESHSVSFAYLVYSSSWIKLHHPAEFVCALLNAQPMGFYSPHTLVRDARRHGVEALGPCVLASRRDCTLEPRSAEAGPIGHPLPGWHAEPSIHAVRIGLRYVRGLSSALLDRIDEERAREPFRDLEDFARRTAAPVDALESLATAGAFACFGVDRRSGLWAAGALRDASADRLPGTAVGVEAPPLPGMSEVEETAADLWATGMSSGKHPTEFVRAELAARGVLTAVGLRTAEASSVVEVAGVVTHRQQPETAKGTIFINLEDETGPDQRDLSGRGVEALPQGGPYRLRAAGARPARTPPGRDQRARAADRGAPADLARGGGREWCRRYQARSPALPRLPLARSLPPPPPATAPRAGCDVRGHSDRVSHNPSERGSGELDHGLALTPLEAAARRVGLTGVQLLEQCDELRFRRETDRDRVGTPRREVAPEQRRGFAGGEVDVDDAVDRAASARRHGRGLDDRTRVEGRALRLDDADGEPFVAGELRIGRGDRLGLLEHECTAGCQRVAPAGDRGNGRGQVGEQEARVDHVVRTIGERSGDVGLREGRARTPARQPPVRTRVRLRTRRPTRRGRSRRAGPSCTRARSRGRRRGRAWPSVPRPGSIAPARRRAGRGSRVARRPTPSRRTRSARCPSLQPAKEPQ